MTGICFYLLLFFAGAAFGSFYYTLFLRYINPDKFNSLKKILTLSSACPECNEKISYISLIPVFGYLIRAGKCRNCGGKIPIHYPLYEIFSGVLFILLNQYYKSELIFLFVFLIVLTAVTLSLVDIKKNVIPNLFVFLILIFSIYAVYINADYSENLYGFIFMSAVFGVILLVFPGSFGGGDFKYAAVIGLLLGLQLSIIAFEISVVSGAIVGTAYGLLSKKGLRIKIPFGPFLTAGLLVALFSGRKIIMTYYNFFK